MSDPSKNELLSILTRATRIAESAGRVLRKKYGLLSAGDIRMKTKNDFVTAVDHESERVILGAIRRSYPKHAIFSEESGAFPGHGFTWVVDPLDGTRNYLGNIPLFCVSIAVCRDGAPLIGAIYDPTRRELFSAAKGLGVWVNGRRVRVSAAGKISESFLSMGIPYRSIHRIRTYTRVLTALSRLRVDHRRSGSCALDLAYVACGRLDGMWAMDQEPWDFSAGRIMIEEAGGRTSDLHGKRLEFKRSDILVSNGTLHTALVKAVSGAL